jgi:tRNA nucleotidyltransferase (CCA-adding enzyme)
MNAIELPKAVIYILSALARAGYEAYIVGGCVRDYLLGKAPKDWDITTSALPEQVKAVFSHTYDTGIEHGTVTVLVDKVGYEVTTYRIDGEYHDNRHPDSVVFTTKLEGDLARRDFTMNAIAYNAEDGFVDEFNGIEDIKNGVIRAVREPAERFQEDALRMMRALRFSAQLNFEIEEKTRLAIVENASLIKNISMERVRDELLKLILSDNPLKLYELKAVGITDYVLSELSELLSAREGEIRAYMESVEADTVKRLALLLHSMEQKPMQSFLKGLRLDNKTIKDTLTLSKYINQAPDNSPYGIRRMICDTCVDMVRNILYMRRTMGIDVGECEKVLDEIIKNGNCCGLAELCINGADLKALGVPNGKGLGEMLNKCLDEVLKNPDNNNKKYLIEEVCGLCMR